MSTPRPRPTNVTPHSLQRLGDEFSWRWSRSPAHVSVTGVSLDSHSVQPGDLFVALPGRHHHGAVFASQALASGAVAVLSDDSGVDQLGNLDASVPVAIASDPRGHLGSLAARIYDPGQALPPVLAVTGTNGKTSVVFFLDEIARALGLVSGMSNTHERRIGDERVSTPLTTPEAPDLQALLALAAQRGVQVMSVEASAQAIERARLEGVVAEVAGFSNLSHDHLEDYGDMDHYFATKSRLFSPQMARRAVVSLETAWGEKLQGVSSIPVVTVGSPEHSPTWSVEITQRSAEKTSFRLSGPEGRLDSSVRALGEHMVRNAALAIVMLIEAGYPLADLRDAIGDQAGGIDRVIPGRLERVSAESDVAVFVDAGRSPDAYRHSLGTLRAVADSALLVVCGTSGNRDRTKRAQMGQIAAEFADTLIVSDDDPRQEDPAQIRADLLSGASRVPDVHLEEIPSQEEAIRRAVQLAQPGDVIAWIGPGSQSYRDVAGQRQPFSARAEAQAALLEAGYINSVGDVAR